MPVPFQRKRLVEWCDQLRTGKSSSSGQEKGTEDLGHSEAARLSGVSVAAIAALAKQLQHGEPKEVQWETSEKFCAGSGTAPSEWVDWNAFQAKVNHAHTRREIVNLWGYNDLYRGERMYTEAELLGLAEYLEAVTGHDSGWQLRASDHMKELGKINVPRPKAAALDAVTLRRDFYTPDRDLMTAKANGLLAEVLHAIKGTPHATILVKMLLLGSIQIEAPKAAGRAYCKQGFTDLEARALMTGRFPFKASFLWHQSQDAKHARASFRIPSAFGDLCWQNLVDNHRDDLTSYVSTYLSDACIDTARFNLKYRDSLLLPDQRDLVSKFILYQLVAAYLHPEDECLLTDAMDFFRQFFYGLEEYRIFTAFPLALEPLRRTIDNLRWPDDRAQVLKRWLRYYQLRARILREKGEEAYDGLQGLVSELDDTQPLLRVHCYNSLGQLGRTPPLAKKRPQPEDRWYTASESAIAEHLEEGSDAAEHWTLLQGEALLGRGILYIRSLENPAIEWLDKAVGTFETLSNASADWIRQRAVYLMNMARIRKLEALKWQYRLTDGIRLASDLVDYVRLSRAFQPIIPGHLAASGV